VVTATVFRHLAVGRHSPPSQLHGVGALKSLSSLPPSRDGGFVVGTEDEQFQVFVGIFAEKVPGLPGNATRAFDLTRHGLLDHAQRSALRHCAVWLNPGTTPGAVDACRTLGDLFDLVGLPNSSEQVLPRGRAVSGEVKLRALRPTDYAALYESSLDPRQSYRWRYRGGTPSPQEFEESLFAGVLAQFAVVDHADLYMHGLVSAYNHRPEVGSCYLAIQRSGNVRGTGGEMISATGLMLDYLFRTFNLRRVYFEVPEYNAYLVEGLLGGLLTQEAELSEHFWHDERFWSLLICYTDRARWSEYAQHIFG
jgi:RimJ/RimL family protein N-acetyltransferase